MEIDWLTVAAQVVNFLVLVWLLHRFLYGPITRAMARREQRIADRLREADEKERVAEREAETYRERTRELDETREAYLARAREEADDLRRSLRDEVREEIERMKRDWESQVADQRETFLADVRRRVGEQFTRLARQALSDLAGAELEAQVAETFIERLGTLDAAARKKIADAARERDARAVVHSAFPLPAPLRERIGAAVRDTIGRETEVAFEVAREVACGIELRVGSQTVSWNLDSYLEGMERRLAAELSGPRPEGGEAAAE